MNYTYGAPTVTPPPGLILGEEWWQQLASYGLGRYIDSETLQPYQVDDVSRQLGVGSTGGLYQRGMPSGLAAAVQSPLVLALGVVAVAGIAYLALK